MYLFIFECFHLILLMQTETIMKHWLNDLLLNFLSVEIEMFAKLKNKIADEVKANPRVQVRKKTQNLFTVRAPQ